MKIYAWNGVNDNDLSATYTWTNPKTGETYNIYPKHNTDSVINMPFEGANKYNANSQGWLRDNKYFFKHLSNEHPEYFSKENLNRINGEKFEAPRVDEKFLEHFPNYDDYSGEKLIHHHIGQDGQAVPVPESMHKGSGGIHAIEKDLGITENAQRHSAKCQEAHDKGQEVTWDNFEQIQGMKNGEQLNSAEKNATANNSELNISDKNKAEQAQSEQITSTKKQLQEDSVKDAEKSNNINKSKSHEHTPEKQESNSKNSTPLQDFESEDSGQSTVSKTMPNIVSTENDKNLSKNSSSSDKSLSKDTGKSDMESTGKNTVHNESGTASEIGKASSSKSQSSDSNGNQSKSQDNSSGHDYFSGYGY